MYGALLQRTLRSIRVVQLHLATSERLRNAMFDAENPSEEQHLCAFRAALASAGAPDRLEWRVIDHCAAVTRVYAIYESFALEMLREHLSLLQSEFSFNDLPNEVQVAYRKGLSGILEKKDGPKYSHLNLKELVLQFAMALDGQAYVLEPAALLIQEQNLRIPELTRLFAACGISGVDAWIDAHPVIQRFFAEGGRLGASSEHEMRELIKYRNDAAHGSISLDELLGLDILYEFCDFVSAVCEAIAERVQKAGIERLVESGGAAIAGRVQECLKHDLVLVGRLVGSFEVGQVVYLLADGLCWERTITSLQVNDESIEKFMSAEPAEIGIGISEPGRRRVSVVLIQRRSAESPDRLADVERIQTPPDTLQESEESAFLIATPESNETERRP